MISKTKPKARDETKIGPEFLKFKLDITDITRKFDDMTETDKFNHTSEEKGEVSNITLICKETPDQEFCENVLAKCL